MSTTNLCDTISHNSDFQEASLSNNNDLKCSLNYNIDNINNKHKDGFIYTNQYECDFLRNDLFTINSNSYYDNNDDTNNLDFCNIDNFLTF